MVIPAAEKSEDKKDIEMEEKEKMQDVPILEVENPSKFKTDSKEGREVQPKKIPIGGIQMPGFFTRSKSKERCKEENEPDNTEPTETKETDGTKNTHNVRIKLPNPFRKSSLLEDGTETPSDYNSSAKTSVISDTKRWLRPFGHFQTKKKDAQQNLQGQAAGLASVETLDENDKSADKKEEELKEISLEIVSDEKKKLEKQTSEEVEMTLRQKLKAYRVVISAFLIFILLVIIIVIVSLPGPINYSAPIRDGRYVQALTSCGFVEGLIEDSSVAFRGIPYARQPVADLRFKPAEPLNSAEYCWNGTYLAHNQTDYCLQLYSNGSMVGVEDCLTLDIITPHVRYDSPLPVVVLIGTETLMGGSPGKMRPSARYARSRDVIFVRPNFRLGVLGFLAADLLDGAVHPPTSGNYGLSDIKQALKWVQLNIEHFGGDRKAVTLFGHRAGATLVTALATSPDSAKLFSRAWATSGSAIFPGKPLAESESLNREYVATIPCNDFPCLQQTDSDFLTNSVPDTWRKPQTDLPAKSEDPLKRHEWLVLDGKILKDDPAKIWTSDEGLAVPLVLGTTAHAGSNEMLFYKHKYWNETLVKQHVNDSKLGAMNLTEEIFEIYPASYQGLISMVSDIRIVCPLLAVSSQMRNSAFYVVTQSRGEFNLTDVDSDVDAILGRYEPKTAEQKRYISAVQQLFYHFVSHGNLPQMGGHSKKLFKLGQDLEHIESYSRCDYWIKKDIVPRYAQLD